MAQQTFPTSTTIFQLDQAMSMFLGQMLPGTFTIVSDDYIAENLWRTYCRLLNKYMKERHVNERAPASMLKVAESYMWRANLVVKQAQEEDEF